jgi:serine/threonine protein phosphatase PrpC
MGCNASKHAQSAIVANPGTLKAAANAVESKKGEGTKVIPRAADSKISEVVVAIPTDGEADGETRARVLSVENIDVKTHQVSEAALDAEVHTRRKMTVLGTHPEVEAEGAENRPRTTSMLNAPTEDLAVPTEKDKAKRLVKGDGGIGNGAHGIASEARSLPVVFSAVSRPGNDPQKRRKENQDTYCLIDQYGQNEDAICACVFDGHGPNGALASAFVKSQLPKVWLDKGIIEATQVDEIKQVLFDGCVEVNKALADNKGVDAYVSGTTGILSYLRGNKFYVANVGDSRAVLARRVNGRIIALDLSDDHKPDRPDEHSRILNSGGRVFEWGVPRVWKRDVDMPGLAMSRSFGDLAAEVRFFCF